MNSPLAAGASAAPVTWTEPAREAAFGAWLQAQSSAHALRPDSVRLASADASFRRYLRIDTTTGASRIVMDAPPDKENSEPFVRIAGLLRDAGLHVPEVLTWDQTHGFLLLSDLGQDTMMARINPEDSAAAAPMYRQALDALLAWQLASRPGVLPAYNEAVLRRELQLFPDWYIAQHKGVALSEAQSATLTKTFDLIVQRCLAMPTAYVHRDFMPRNLMVRPDGEAPATPAQALGVLDFQDALHGPITYDIASLMRDAFLSWDEDFVLDVTVRYWEKARKAGLMDFEDWHSDFGAFYRAVEWMGLQRHLKVAGIFARLTLRDGKAKYLADTPRFIHYIRSTAHRYRELGPLLKLVDEIEGLQAASGWAFGRV